MTDPYRLEVAALLRTRGSRAWRFEADLPLDTGPARVAGPVIVKAKVESAQGLLTVSGTVAGPVTLTCNRCLKERGEERVFALDALYAHEADDDLLPIEEGWLDLEPAVRAAVAIELPMAPLCRPDCRGLCPTCGTDLNKEPCSGHEDESDSPFAALQHLLDQD